MSATEPVFAAFQASIPETAFKIKQQNIRPYKRLKVLLSVLLAFVLLSTAAVVAFYGYVTYKLMDPPIPALASNPLKAIGTPYADVTFPAANGKTTLSGWYIPGESRNTVILSHGYGGNREEPWISLYNIASELHKNRFNVLMFDYGFVRPENKVTGGIQESQELKGAIRFVKELGDDQIYIWGFSMGAGTALQTALTDSVKDIDGMILDSTFLLDPDTMFFNLKQRVNNLPRHTSVFMVNLLSPFISGHSLSDVPYKLVKETKYSIPIFMIHGQRDKVAPYQTVTRFFESQDVNSASQLWIIPDGRHEMLYKYHKQEYIQRTMKFLYDSVNRTNASRFVSI